MTASEIKYARVPDGSHVAYRVTGQGPISLLEYGGFGSLFPLDAADEQPRWRRFEERLGGFCRLIRFDHRGVGYSDAIEGPTLDTWVTDGLAVVDSIGLDQVSILATGHDVMGALAFTAANQDRVSSLILANGYARAGRAPDYPVGLDPDDERYDGSIVDPSADEEEEKSDIDTMAPSLAADEEARRWWRRWSRRGSGPGFAHAHWDLCLWADVRNLLPAITQRTLVLYTADNEYGLQGLATWLADHLPNAQARAIPGRDQVIWAVPDDLVTSEIEEFLTGSRSAATGTRAMTAVLFTDIVESTAHNADSGDRQWAERMEKHDALATDQVRRHGGRVIKTLGDGLLATFPLASDALDAGSGISDGAAGLGLDVRAAVHVAEIETVDDDVIGLGVTVAARVLAEAKGGEVLATRAVADLLAGCPFEYETRGVHDLKGVPGKWELGSVRRRSSP